MRPVTLTQAGPGSTSPCPMDIRLNPANVALQCRITADPSPSPSASPEPSVSPGPDGYVVETTDSDVWGSFPFTTQPDPSAMLWTPHPDFVNQTTGITEPKTDDWVGNLAFPATAVRLRLTADYDSTVELRIIQSGF